MVNQATPSSMTGFASLSREQDGWRWNWDVRSVNSRGLDLRLRVPDWIEGLDAAIRNAVKGKIARGAVTIALRLTKSQAGADTAMPEAELLDAALRAIRNVEVRAREGHALQLSASNAAEVIALARSASGSSEPSGEEMASLSAMLVADLGPILDDLTANRRDEGARLGTLIAGQLDEIARLTDAAADELAARADQTAVTLRDNLARVLENSEGADPDRVAQELALIAVKSDVTEEIDRLRAHVEAGRALLSAGGPVGRKLDFLTQEFNREANTLCSKAQQIALTRIGLDLKAVIDQMREQVQNVE